MRKILFLIVLFSTYCFGQNSAQIQFEENYDRLLENLSNENWIKAEKLAKRLLDFAESVDSMQIERKVLRYIYIYATAGLLNEKKLTKHEALEKVLFLKSKEMMMPSHPFNKNCNINCTHISEEDKNTFFTGVNNQAGTQIFCFEYVQIENGISESETDLEGKNISLQGILNEISVEGNMLPRFKLKFINGIYAIE